MEAEYQLLDIARKTDMYGIVPHQCHNQHNVSIQLAVTHTGIHTFINATKTDSYLWFKIRKLGFKRKRFLIKLIPGEKQVSSLRDCSLMSIQ